MGQDDASVKSARQILGADKIVGATAKTIEQAQIAQEQGADYLGSGAVFGSTTKKDALPMTMELLNEICNSVQIPVVAIGGINLDNASTLIDTGIAGLSVVSAIMSSENPKKSSEELLNIFNS